MPENSHRLRLSVVLSVFLALSGCSTQGGGLGGLFGQIVTTAFGAAGAYGGSRIGHGVTPYITGPIGATIGAWIGNSITSSLNSNAQQLMASATQNAAETGQAQTWNETTSGATGRAEVVQPFPASQASSDPTMNNYQPCRLIAQSVLLNDGSNRSDQVTVCKNQNGWLVKQ